MAKKLAFDKTLFTVVMLLLGLGLVTVYSASSALAHGGGSRLNPFLAKQALAAGLGLGGMVLAMHLDYRRLESRRVAWLLTAVSVSLLVLVLFSAPINASRRWFFVGGLSVQPAELAKLALVGFIAHQIHRKADRINRPELLVPCGLVLALMVGLVLLQPDMGTALLLLATGTLMLFLAGLSWKLVLSGAAAMAPVVWFLVISVPYRRQRLFAFLDPEKDPLGSGFQALQSLIAVGSGGLFGLGPGNSLQKLYFVPHPHSDFIFAILAEELGLIGACTVLALFLVLLWRGVLAGLRAPDLLGRHLAWGLTAVLVLQALINISVALALLPTKGIPLPFISYGGSSLVVTLVACGVLLNVSQHG